METARDLNWFVNSGCSQNHVSFNRCQSVLAEKEGNARNISATAFAVTYSMRAISFSSSFILLGISFQFPSNEEREIRKQRAVDCRFTLCCVLWRRCTSSSLSRLSSRLSLVPLVPFASISSCGYQQPTFRTTSGLKLAVLQISIVFQVSIRAHVRKSSVAAPFSPHKHSFSNIR